MNLGGFVASFSRVADIVMSFLYLNCLWLLFNFPIIYLSIDLLFRQSFDEVIVLLSVIIALIPFLGFPATAALLAIVRRWIMKRPVGHLFKRFVKHYKENYIRSMFGGLIFLPIYLLWIWNFLLSDVTFWTGAFYFHIIILFIIVTLTYYYFADMVHMQISFIQSMQKIIFMSLFYFPYTLGAAAAAIIVLLVLILIHPIVFILFSMSLVSYIYFFAYYQIYNRAKQKEESEVQFR
ncbi:MAG TPA: DUF624 domain-containing protein [Pseudogracilibacillus sp.]|nr:DUF624 domain-containing protein [Pseudogracilibacillus sp.]